MRGLTDTSPEAERVLAEVYRRMTPARKWLLLEEVFRCAAALQHAGRRLHGPRATNGPGPDPTASPDPLGQKDGTMTQPEEALKTVREVIAVFDRLGIRYALGGSFASSLHGQPRLTRDADIAVDPFPGREPELLRSFGPDYYLSATAIDEAVRERRSFNIINTVTGFKVDVFVRGKRPFDQSLMERRTAITLPDEPEHPVAFVTAEDIVLQKLEWYRLGGEVSERQWLDVLEVLRVRAGQLDEAYLDRWAADLGVADLLARVRGELMP
ncbi:MAG TPA: hypothetical protein VF590_22860 [Isosphaeraceae bacterium]|jgi:hypothetical protein